MKVYAEISANHRGSLDAALGLVDAAAEAGATGVKIQLWTPGTMVRDLTGRLHDGPWAGRNLVELYEEAHTPAEWVAPIFTRARERGIEPFASVFDAAALEFLELAGCGMYKVASCELVDLPLIEAIAKTGKPMILSTGMATRAEIEEGLAAAGGPNNVTLLQCRSAYPTDPVDSNLLTMVDMKVWSGCEVGISDHTPGITVALVAAGLGASAIEKHLVMDDGNDTLDRAFSITPDELATLCREAPRAAACTGAVVYGPVASELPQLALRRSLWVTKDIKAGEPFTIDNVGTARPALGLHPSHLAHVLRGVADRDYSAGTPLTLLT